MSKALQVIPAGVCVTWACLEFYQNKRPVSTASVTQMRKPIYSSSVVRWKRYEKHLAPLIAVVQSEIEKP